MALALGMSPDQLMATHSERQILVWWDKLQEDFNRPSRSDYYLMQLATELYRSWIAEKDKAPSPNVFRLKFGEEEEGTATEKPKPAPPPPPKELTREEMRIRRKNATMAAQMKWFGVAGPPKGV